MSTYRNTREALPTEGEGFRLTKDTLLRGLLSEDGGSGLTYIAETGGVLSIVKEYFAVKSPVPLRRENAKIVTDAPGDAADDYRKTLGERIQAEISITNRAAIRDGYRTIYAFDAADLTKEVHAFRPELQDSLTGYVRFSTMQGCSLQQYLEKNTPDYKRCLELTLSVLYSYERICLQGERPFLHLDIKPSNLFLLADTDYTAAVLLDFGSGMEEGKIDFSLLTSSAGYSAYEQQEPYPEHLDRSADLFAISAVFLHMLTGKTVRDIAEDCVGAKREDRLEFYRKLLNEAGHSLHFTEVDALADFFDKSFCYYPGTPYWLERFQSPAEYRSALEKIRDLHRNKGINGAVLAKTFRPIPLDYREDLAADIEITKS